MLTGIFAIILSIGCFWFSFKFISAYIKVKGWIKTEAIVLSKEVKLHEKYSTSRSPYAVKVTYSYLFNNTEYKNNTLYLAELLGGQVNHMEQSANKRIAEIKDKALIFVNPNNPEQSVMFCEGILLYVLISFIGLIALMIGIYSMFGST